MLQTQGPKYVLFPHEIEYKIKYNQSSCNGTIALQDDGWLLLGASTASTYLSLLTDGAFFQVGWSWSELNT